MSLTPTRFTTVHVDHVTVRVNSSDEARHALKELKHLKKELRAELRSLKSALRKAKARETRRTRTKPQPLFESFSDYVRISVASLGTLFQAEARKNSVRSAAELARDVRGTEGRIASVDACVLEIEGKLIADAAPN
ncbi:MAG: hypothetical protein AAFY27_01280 [Pseudomonadota bacterium]